MGSAGSPLGGKHRPSNRSLRKSYDILTRLCHEELSLQKIDENYHLKYREVMYVGNEICKVLLMAYKS